jgi:hypothetical protein
MFLYSHAFKNSAGDKTYITPFFIKKTLNTVSCFCVLLKIKQSCFIDFSYDLQGETDKDHSQTTLQSQSVIFLKLLYTY